ncbi:MAG: hypothetical protein NVSMB14_14800 [Isosphaeraceae bacterium]
MNLAIASSTSWSKLVVSFGLDLAIKSAALLLIGLIVQRILGARRASIGSSIGHACLVGLAQLPLSTLFFPWLQNAVRPDERKTSQAITVKASLPPIERNESFERTPPPFGSTVDDLPIEPKTEIKIERGAHLSLSAAPLPISSPPAPSLSIDWFAAVIGIYAGVAVVL